MLLALLGLAFVELCGRKLAAIGAQLLAIWLDAHVFHPAMRLLLVYVLLVTGDTLLID